MSSSAKIQSKLQEWSDSIQTSLNEQVWFQQLKAKWEELDPQSRTYLKFASVGVGVLLCLFLVMSYVWKVHSLKNELTEKQSLLNIIQTSNDEMRRLRDSLPPSAKAGGDQATGTWPEYLETVTAPLGIDKANISVANEKQGVANEQSRETLMDLTIKHVNVKQLIRAVHAVETGARPMKLRNLSVKAEADLSGYLDATLSLSGFSLVHQQ